VGDEMCGDYDVFQPPMNDWHEPAETSQSSTQMETGKSIVGIVMDIRMRRAGYAQAEGLP
jgi:hypothetical protein